MTLLSTPPPSTQEVAGVAAGQCGLCGAEPVERQVGGDPVTAPMTIIECPNGDAWVQSASRSVAIARWNVVGLEPAHLLETKDAAS